MTIIPNKYTDLTNFTNQNILYAIILLILCLFVIIFTIIRARYFNNNQQ